MFKKKIPNLFKSKAGEQVTEEQVEAVDEFDTAMTELQKSAGEEVATEEVATEEVATEEVIEGSEEGAEEELNKAAPGKKGTPEEHMETASEEADEHDTEGGVKGKDGKKKKKKKGKDGTPDKEDMKYSREGKEPEEELNKSESLEVIMEQDNPEAKAAMEVEPWLKSLVTGIDRKLDMIKSEIHLRIDHIGESINGVTEFQKSLSKVVIAEGNMIKSALSMDEESLNQPQELQSITTHERFQKSLAQNTLSPVEAKAYLTTFAKSKVLGPTDVSKIENRINRGMELPQNFLNLIEKEQHKSE